MAEKIVSPGVFTRENDLSFLQEGVGAIGAAVVGPLPQGPAFVPTVINTQSEFRQIFGETNNTFYTQKTVENYLREAGTVTVARVGGVGGYQQNNAFGIFASGSDGRTLIATIHSTEEGISDGDHENVGFGDVSFQDITGSVEFTLSGSLGQVTASVVRSATNDIQSKYGLSALGTKNGYLYTYFVDEAKDFSEDIISGSVNLEGEVITESQDFSYDMSNAYTPWIVSNDRNADVNVSGSVNPEDIENLFRFRTKGAGNTSNTQFKVSITNIQGEENDFATFTVLIRDFNDTDRRPRVLESWSNVNLDPTSPNFIARVIGDRYQTVDSDGRLQETGSWPSNSQYVTVEVAPENSYNNDAVPYGHIDYTNTVALTDSSEFPEAPFKDENLENDAGDTTGYGGIDIDDVDSFNFFKPIPENVGQPSTFYLLSEPIPDPINIGQYLNEPLFDAYDNDADVVAKRQFTIGFQGGFDGKSPAISNAKGSDITDDNSQGFDLTGDGSGSLSYQRIASVLENQDLFDFNLIVTPGVVKRLHSNVYQQFEDLVETRQDAFYIADLVGSADSISQVVNQAGSIDSSYVGTYYPWVRVVDNRTNQQVTVPPSVLLPAIYAANDRISAEWFAPAGLNRGGIVGAVGVENKLTQGDRDTLYEGKVNPIASFPGQGIVAWGQKTLQERPSALDRINVRRLLISLKKFIASTSRFLVFEQNTATTRNRFINTVNPFMESIQQRQGLYAFRVVMDESNNPPDVVDRNILQGSIFLQPTRTAEFIVIDFNVLPTGATFDA